MGRRLGSPTKVSKKGMHVNSTGSKHRAINMPQKMNGEFSDFLEELEDNEKVNADNVNSNAVMKLMIAYCLKTDSARKFVAKHLSSPV